MFSKISNSHVQLTAFSSSSGILMYEEHVTMEQQAES